MKQKNEQENSDLGPPSHHVLDCTLRDGGYYNNWDFSPGLVQRYLDSIALTGVRIVEMGFRSRHQAGYRGPCYYTTDDFLASLSIPDHLEVAVMVNASDLLADDHPWAPIQTVNDLFAYAESCPVDWVRIAAHPEEIGLLGPSIDRLKALGYKVGLNIMQVSRLTTSQLEASVAMVASRIRPDILYFADSLGNMTPACVRNIIETIRTQWSGALGIHTHDNMGLALANSIEAMRHGTTWIDGTVHGMGRGAGNASTEALLIQLAQQEPNRFYPTRLFDLIREDFTPMHHKYGWGSNIYYAYAASHAIHPTYVQQMLSTDLYQLDDVMAALETLAKAEGKSRYSSKSLSDALQANYVESTGSWTPSTWVAGRPVLLLANGPSAREHRQGIMRFIDRVKPVVICMNHVSWIEPAFVDAYAFCHPTRLASFIEQTPELKAPIITPVEGISSAMRERLADYEVFDYGLIIDAGKTEIHPADCRLQAPFVAGYALALAYAGGAREVLLAGFDGHGGNIARIADMNRCFSQLRAATPDLVVTSVTECPYQVEHDSIYSPRWIQAVTREQRNYCEATDRHSRTLSI